MVFSFFKKPPEKMTAKAVVVPAGKKPRTSPSGVEKEGGRKAAAAKTVAPDATAKSSAAGDQQKSVNGDAAVVMPEFSDFVFSECAPEFQVEVDMDPVDAQAEEAAVLFSNAQDDAARMVLEATVHDFRSGKGERLWLMLFDLYRVMCDRTAFEALGIEYAGVFEKSPPVWRDVPSLPEKSSGIRQKIGAAAGSVSFNGPLTADNDMAFEAIDKVLDKHRKLRLDLGKVEQFDAAGCARLVAVLQRARKGKADIALQGLESLGAKIAPSIEVGRREDKDCWFLLLEIYQLQGLQEAFDELAINYAVTFEESPPSWDARRVMAVAPEAPGAENVGADAGADADVASDELADLGSMTEFALRGELKGAKFAQLAIYGEQADPVIVDCSELIRMDFVSAATLLNVVTSFCAVGKRIVFKLPNRLVAELFRVLGLSAVATIVFGKH